jgi:hypothetical protein
VAIAVGASAVRSTPVGSVPLAAGGRANYRRLIGPALAYEAALARAQAFWATATYALPATTLFASLRAEQSAPLRDAPERLQPVGQRSGHVIAVGVRY